MSDYFFIGIDGGATSCRARIRDADGNLLGEGCSGPANIQLDWHLANESICGASRAAVRAAELDERALHRAHAGLGLAGAGLKSACDRLRAERNLFASIELGTDAYIAWLGAHRGSDGGVVILGTGSCGLAIVNGRRIDVGGWGAKGWVGKRSAERYGPLMDEPSGLGFRQLFSIVSNLIQQRLFPLRQLQRRLSTPHWHHLSSIMRRPMTP